MGGPGGGGVCNSEEERERGKDGFQVSPTGCVGGHLKETSVREEEGIKRETKRGVATRWRRKADRACSDWKRGVVVLVNDAD